MRVTVICAMILIIAVVSIASAYDRDEFDDFFHDELDQQIYNRVRRSNKHQKKGRDDDTSSTTQVTDGDKKRRQRRSCCGENDDLKLLWSEGVRDLKKECFDQARKATEVTKKARTIEEYEGFIRGNRTKDDYICAVQCIGQKKEVLDRMGNVNIDKMEKYMKSTYSSEPWKAEIADTLLEKCFTETQKPSEGEVSTDNGDVTNGRSVLAKCNSNGIAFIHCLWRQMHLNCPAEKTRDSRKCNRLRESLRLRESGVKEGTAQSIF